MATPSKPKTALAALFALVGTAVGTYLISDIRSDEGTRYHAYRDVGQIVSICNGDTHNVRMGDVATVAQCDERTASQLLVHAKIVIGCVPALREVGREPQLRAVTRFDYNTGRFCTGSVGRLMKAGQWRAGCDALLRYDMAGGRHIRGLALRRQREHAICLKGLS